MKKLLFMLFILLVIPNICLGEENYFYLDVGIPGIYTMMDKIDKVAANYVRPVRRGDNDEYVYCVTPGVAIEPDGNYAKIITNPWSTLNISKEKYERIELISYFGYNYKDHTDLTWYAITQYLIWQEVFPPGWSVYFTETLRGPKTNKFDWMIDELNNLVNNYYTNPSLNLSLEANYKIETRYTDTNNVLSNYKSNNPNALIDNNNLIIKPSNNNFNFKLYYNTNSTQSNLFTYNNAQWLVSRATPPAKELKYTVTIPKGSLKITKEPIYNQELDILPNIDLSGAVYAVYNDDYYKEFITDDNGEIYIDNLNLGYYTIKEVTPPKGFNLSLETYDVEIIKNQSTNLIVNDSCILGTVEINKKYLDRDTYEELPEQDAVFVILDSLDKVLVQKNTDQDGLVKFYLPIGEYKLKQISGRKGYKLVNDETIIIEDDGVITKDYINKPATIKENEVKTILVDNPNTVDNIKSYLLIGLLSIIILIVIFLKNNKKRRK